MEKRIKKLKCEIYRDSFQNSKRYGIPKAQLIIADAVYFMPGWDLSKGACMERGYAVAKDLIILGD